MSNLTKKIIIFLIFFCNATFCFSQENIIFFGNSYTAERYINTDDGQILYLPSVSVLVADIAEAAGKERPNIFDASYSSAFLTGHLNNSIGYIYSEIPSNQEWNYVVMQDQSVRPTLALGNRWQHKTSAYSLYNAVRNHSPNVRPVLFQTWARESSHSYYPDSFNDPNAMQLELREGYQQAYTYIDDRTDQTPLIAPVGDVWQFVNWDDLYLTDKTHMNARGRLLSALVIYTTLYDDGVLDLYQNGSLINILQNISLDIDDGLFLTESSDNFLGITQPCLTDCESEIENLPIPKVFLFFLLIISTIISRQNFKKYLLKKNRRNN